MLSSDETPGQHKRHPVMQDQTGAVRRVDVIRQPVQDLVGRIKHTGLTLGMQRISQSGAIMPERQCSMAQCFRHELLLRKEVRICVAAHQSSPLHQRLPDSQCQHQSQQQGEAPLRTGDRSRDGQRRLAGIHVGHIGAC
jgi:hypothetical protein